MAKLICTASYDGTYFSGYQIQPNKRTVQNEIQVALTRMHKGQEIQITASGRTDAGVHAAGQVFHFESPLTIEHIKWAKALNNLLPNDIDIRKVEDAAEGFHARYDVKEKEYRYRLLTGKGLDMFRRLYSYHLPMKLDINQMKRACLPLLGTHDFTSFCASNTGVVDKVRTLYGLDVFQENDEVIIQVIGSGFLYQMVRIITGTLIEVGLGKLEPSDINIILSNKDRRTAPSTAPAHGLTLWRVTY